MVATTDEKARLLDLVTGVLELVRDGKRSAGKVADVLQIVKEERDFLERLGFGANGTPNLGTVQEQLARLQPLYKELFWFDFNPEEIRIPEAPPEWNRLIVTSDELRPNRIVTGLRERYRMQVETYGVDLDKETLPRRLHHPPQRHLCSACALIAGG